VRVVGGALPGGRWAWFAGSLLLTAGTYNAVWGAAALAGQSYFTPDELLLHNLDEDVWGAMTLAWGLALIATALLVYGQFRAGVVLGMVVAGTNAIIQLLSIEAFPAWSVAALALDLLLMYALWRAARTAAGHQAFR